MSKDVYLASYRVSLDCIITIIETIIHKKKKIVYDKNYCMKNAVKVASSICANIAVDP